MEVTKEQIAKGAARFIQEDIIPSVGDTAMQIVLGIAAGTIETNPKLLDKVLENEMLLAVAKSGNNYNLTVLQNAAVSAIDKYGKLSVTIPGIKFISPDDKVLQFGSDDVRRLMARIEGR